GIVIGFFVASGVLLILFFCSQTILPEEKPLFRCIVFCQKISSYSPLPPAPGSYIIFVAVYYIPLFFQFTRGDSAMEAVVRLLPQIILLVFTTVGSGVLLSMTGYYTPGYMFGGIFVTIDYYILHIMTPRLPPATIPYTAASVSFSLAQESKVLVGTPKQFL